MNSPKFRISRSMVGPDALLSMIASTGLSNGRPHLVTVLPIERDPVPSTASSPTQRHAAHRDPDRPRHPARIRAHSNLARDNNFQMDLLPILVSFAGGSMSSTLLTRFLDRRRLKYAAEGITVIEKRDSVDGLSIRHNGNDVDRLTRSHIWLWNAGRKAIRPSDVVAANPLKATFPDAKLLELTLVHSTEGAIGFQTKRLEDSSWLIEFDHWEARHGVVLEALHTSTRVVPKLTGSVDGLQPIQSLGRIDNGSFLSKRRRALRRWLPVLAAVALGGGMWAVVVLRLGFDIKTLLAFALIAPGELLLLLSFSVGVGAFWVPKDLRQFSRPFRNG
ncbi:hypothetical protein [Burkholderia ubonensis]|uniref:hypothetical protein n=1 Tax=Burkholderia ubonensis TaxID=101571 RepID=UPI000B09266E|nr:hypothetical protein [Burkholderia ubonensis]